MSSGRGICLAAFLLPLLLEPVEDAPETVDVGPYALRPALRLTYADDRLELHPKAYAGIGYTDNVHQASEEEAVEDFYHSLLGAVEFRYFLSESETVLGMAELRTENYLDEDDRDLVSGRGSLEYHWGDLFWRIDGTGNYERSDEGTVETARGIEAELWGGEIDVAYQGLDLTLNGMLWGRRVDYLEDAIAFTRDERDRIEGGLRLQMRRALGEITGYGMRLEGVGTVYDRDRAYHENYLLEVLDRFQRVWIAALEAEDRATYDRAFRDYRRMEEDYAGMLAVMFPPAIDAALDTLVRRRGRFLLLQGFLDRDDPIQALQTWYRSSLEAEAEAAIAAAVRNAGLQGCCGTRLVLDPWQWQREVLRLWGRPVEAEDLSGRLIVDDGTAFYDRLPDPAVASERQDSVGARLVGEYTHPLGRRTAMRSWLGAEARLFDHDFRGDPDYDDRYVIWPLCGLAVEWHYREDDLLSLAVESQLADGILANATGVAGAKLSVRHHLLAEHNLLVRADVGYTYRRDSGSDAGVDTLESHTVSGGLGCQYEFRSGIALGAQAEYHAVDFSPLLGDYDQFVVEVDAAFAF